MARPTDARRATLPRRLPGVGDLVVPALDAVFEGAWVALVYVTLQVALGHAPAVLGPLAFALAAGVGLAWARAARGRLATTPVGACLAVGAGLAGWLADPAARDALVAWTTGGGGLDALETALLANAAGWLLGFAVVRGASHRWRARDEERVGRLLGRILLLAIPWVVGLAFAGADRTAFVAQAVVCTLLFAGSGLLAVGLGRLETYGAGAGVDWRRNRAWVAVVALVVALLLAVSVPAAFLVGAPPSAILDAAWLSFSSIAGLIGVLVVTVGAPLQAGLEAIIAALPTPSATPLPQPSVPPLGGSQPVPEPGDPRVGLTLAILALVGLAILLVVVVGRIRSGPGPTGRIPPDGVPAEERSIEPPALRLGLPTLRLPRPRRIPTTAPDAYLALLADLAADPVAARGTAETPREHAARLRRAGGAAASSPRRDADARTRRDLSLLVADWELARYGERRLTPAEDRRGVARWRRLRTSLRGIRRDGAGERPGKGKDPWDTL